MANVKRVGNDLTEGNVVRQMILFSLPMLLSSALQQVYSIVDMLVVGQMIGSTGLASVSVASQVVLLMTSLCTGLSGGSQVLVAQYVGAKKREDLNRLIGNVFFIHAAGALLFAFIGAVFCNPILNLVNAPAEAFSGARGYLVVTSIGMIFVYGYNMVSAILRGMGDSTRPMIFIIISSCLNILLDLLFVGPLKMGATGAALATIMSQAISFFTALVFLFKRRESFGFDFKPASFLPNGEMLRKLLGQGIPNAIQMSAITGSILFIGALINNYGVAASAAFGVGTKIEHIPNIAAQGFANAVAAMVGQNFAAGKYDRIRTCTRVSLVVSLVTYAIFSTLYLIFPRQLFGLFTDDPAVLDLAKTVLWSMVLSYPASIMMNAYRGIIIGVGNAKLNLALGIFDGVVLRIGLALLFGSVFKMGLLGFCVGYSCAAYGTGIPAVIYYLSGRWKKRRALTEKQ